MKKEDGSVYFDADEQAVIDKAVQERVARAERKPPEDYNELKEIEKILEDFDFKGSTSEKKEALKQLRETQRQEKELKELQQQAADEGITPALAKEIKDLKEQLKQKTKVLDEIIGEREAIKKAEEQKKVINSDAQKQIAEFSDKYKDIDVVALLNNPKFMKYTGSKNITSLIQEYEDFCELIGEAEKEAIIKVKSKEERSTSGGKGGSHSEGSYGLTEQQKRLAEKSGMSFKEYAGYLKQL